MDERHPRVFVLGVLQSALLTTLAQIELGVEVDVAELLQPWQCCLWTEQGPVGYSAMEATP